MSYVTNLNTPLILGLEFGLVSLSIPSSSFEAFLKSELDEVLYSLLMIESLMKSVADPLII